MNQVRDIGIDVRAPKREPAPGDRLNPFNGSLPVRGATIVGRVVSARMQGTVVVEKQQQRLVEKYDRFEKRTRRYAAHLPSNIDVVAGDEVLIAECRPISKTVKFVVVENRTQGQLPPPPMHQRDAPAKAKKEPEAAKPKAPAATPTATTATTTTSAATTAASEEEE